MQLNQGTAPSVSNIHLLLAYVTDLELEVDRLRKQGQFVQHEVRGTLKRIRTLSGDGTGARSPKPEQTGDGGRALSEIDHAAKDLGAVLNDLQETPGYHPAHDQVIPVAVRPLIEQVFRWQQRLVDAPKATLRIELHSEHVEWFPGRLRHILDNLISNALKYRDEDKAETWVKVHSQAMAEAFEFQVSDNGFGLPPDEHQRAFELFYRASPTRAAGMGVGLAVVKLLVEQSGGTLTVDSVAGEGSTFVVVLPRYDVADYIT